MACVDLPELPLQLLLRRRPGWRGRPTVVVDCDRPQGKVLWASPEARGHRVLPGLRYAAALSLAPGLRAAVVAADEVEACVVEIGARLRLFTPHVEPARGEPGVLWLDARGLERLHPSLVDWGSAIRSDLEAECFTATVVVGFGRFGTYAIARAGSGVHVLKSPADERAQARAVALDRLALEFSTREALARLGVVTVGGFVDLPEEGIFRRFGPAARRLHRLAAGERQVPLQPERPTPPAIERRVLDHPETDAARLLVVVEQLLTPLLETLSDRARALAELRVGFRFERLGDHVETVRPAGPTLDPRLLLDLVRLRLQAVRTLPDAVGEVVLVAGEAQAVPRQLGLESQRARRDLAAADRALARVRARLGEGSVVQAELREGHLPEARFAWKPMAAMPKASPGQADAPRLVRRVHAVPIALPHRSRHEPDGWMLRDLAQGPVVRIAGPYVVSGGWWRRRSVRREYHFVETKQGELLWVYFDRSSRRWFLQGRLE